MAKIKLENGLNLQGGKGGPQAFGTLPSALFHSWLRSQTESRIVDCSSETQSSPPRAHLSTDGCFSRAGSQSEPDPKHPSAHSPIHPSLRAWFSPQTCQGCRKAPRGGWAYAPSKLPLRQWVLRAPGPHPTRIAVKPLTQLDTGPHMVLQLHIHPGSTL